MRLLKKILLWFLGVFVTILLLAYGVFYFFQDTIKTKIVAVANESIHGEVAIDKLGLSLFTDFPNAVIELKGIGLYEEKRGDTTLHNNPILNVTQLGASVNIPDAINGFYSVGSLKLEGADITIIGYADSTLNVLNAIETNGEEDTTTSEGSIQLNLDKIEVSNVHLMYDDRLANQQVSAQLNTLKSKLNLKGDSLSGNLDLDLRMDSMMMDSTRFLKTHTLTLISNFESDLKKLAFRIYEGTMKLDLLEANLEGSYDHLDSGYVDMHISANHNDLSELAKMEILNPAYVPDVKKGRLMIDARIKGSTSDRLPVVEANVYLRDLQIDNAFGTMVDKTGFNLKLYSGERQDMSDGKAYIDSLEVAFSSGGFVRGSAEVINFDYPSFKVNWDASETLDDLNRLFRFSEVSKMNGKVNTSARLKGQFNLKTSTLVSIAGALDAQFENCNITLNQNNYKVEHLNGSFYMKDGDVGINDITVNANGNDILASGKIVQAIPYVLGRPAELSALLSFKSNHINTERLLGFDKKLAENTKYTIDSIDVALVADLSSKALDNYEIVPSGNLEIQNITAHVAGYPSLKQFAGKIKVRPDTLDIKNLKGSLEESPINLSLGVTNYASYLKTDEEKPVDITIGFKSDQLVARDVFTINNEFLLPENYEKEVLKNFEFNTKLITTNKELQKANLLPEFEFQLTGLQFETLYTPIAFKDISVFGLIKDNSVYINGLFGKFGQSDVFLNAEFTNALATKDTVSRPLKSRVSFNSGVLNLDELVKLQAVGSSGETKAESDTTQTSNPFADDFPIIDFNVNIGELTYYDAVIKNLSGIMKIEDGNIIQLNHVKLESGEFGSFDFDGTLDASSHSEAILRSTIKVKDVDLSNLNVSYVQNGENVRIGDHFAGVFNGEIVADVPVSPDFSIDLGRVTGKVKAKITDGALINYAPLREMGKYFKNKDLDNVRFDELKNTMILNSGKMLLPFMTINTTIGTINLMGYQTLDYNMAYDIQVPIKLVAGAALNSLFASKKGDDEKEDKVKNSDKGKYLTVHISGDIDNYKFKLGKKHVLTPPPGFVVD